ncbi:LysR family transcriptional regulator [Marinovum sp. 2_MG-2023]|uniref:LysR family transcriptional regulator n=1 Tax=unclassified Marinovum TaxID=2647166 RepID=UPI0026E25583|nr:MULTISPECIES: LysR family transcriptional regulator [unclassified Marinovum]MDO6732612.1 LysR family transcriptional regulator [Marinovum sp. 2_MG-2023]MDO6781911.1 LysR family transcriptional regulator [Marinovum sp. 1_MG-2023]
MNIRMRQLRAFRAIVETGSVSEAADHLGLTQSTVSKMLAGFEADLGFDLFERVGRRLRLSEQGRMFLERTGYAIDLLEDIQSIAEDIRDNQGRRVRICAIGPTVFSRLIPEAIAHFVSENPGFSFLIEMKTRAVIEDWVIKRQSDIGITLLPVDHGQLDSRSIATVSAVAVVSNGHPLANRKELSPSDLVGESIIIPKRSVRLRGLVEAGFIQQGVELQPLIETSTGISALHLAAQGLGVTVVDPFTVTGVDTRDLCVIRWRPETQLDYGVIWPRHRSLTRQETDIVDCAVGAALDLGERYPEIFLTG